MAPRRAGPVTSCGAIISTPKRCACITAAARQIASTQARREAKIVFDARTQARLSTGGLAIDHHRLQSLRGSVDRGRQTSGTAADNREVIELRVGAGLQPDFLGELAWTSTETFACRRETR